MITEPLPPPPFTVSVVLCPLQMVVADAVAETGFAGTLFTEIVTETQAVFTEQGAAVSYLPK